MRNGSIGVLLGPEDGPEHGGDGTGSTVLESVPPAGNGLPITATEGRSEEYLNGLELTEELDATETQNAVLLSRLQNMVDNKTELLRLQTENKSLQAK